MSRFSGYILCYNDVITIEMAVRCLSFYVEDLTVIDAGSTDGSLELLEQLKDELGIEIVKERQGTPRYCNWDKQPEWRNMGVNLAKNDYIITLDADECFTNDFRPFIDQHGLVVLPRYNMISATHYITECHAPNGKGGMDVHSWFPDYQARIFDRRTFYYPDVKEHCRPARRSDDLDCMSCQNSIGRGAIVHYRMLARGPNEARIRECLRHKYICEPLPVTQPFWTTFSRLPGHVADP